MRPLWVGHALVYTPSWSRTWMRFGCFCLLKLCNLYAHHSGSIRPVGTVPDAATSRLFASSRTRSSCHREPFFASLFAACALASSSRQPSLGRPLPNFGFGFGATLCISDACCCFFFFLVRSQTRQSFLGWML